MFGSALKNLWSGINTGKKEEAPAAPVNTTGKPAGTKIEYPFELHKIKLQSGLEIAYIDEGKKNDTIILFLHGMGCGIPGWRKNIESLRKKYRCIAIDLPGHGFSQKSKLSFSINFYSKAVKDFISALNLNPVILVGHSLGGQIAVTTAITKPALIKKLVLVAPSGLEPYYETEREMQITAVSAGCAAGNAFNLNDVSFITGFNSDIAEAKKLLSELAFFNNEYVQFAEMKIKSVTAILREPITEKLKQINHETLVIVGEHDKVSPFNYLRFQSFASIVRTLCRKIPDVEIIAVPDGGHFIPYQQPELFNQALVDFIK